MIYSSIVVYSFYCELKGVKSKEDMPDTSATPSNVTSPGSNTSHRPPPVPTKTEGNIREDVRMQTDRFNVRRMLPSSIKFPRASPIPPKTQENVHVYDDMHTHTARKNLGFGAATANEGQYYPVYEYTLPERNSNQFN